jgi:hypothetical protein
MRVAKPRGELGRTFPNAWAPQFAPLLTQVLQENRRYQRIRNPRLLKQYELQKVNGRWQCSEELARQTGGLTYAEMVGLSERANFRHALWQMGEAIAGLFEQVVDRTPELQVLNDTPGPSWAEITARWKRAK